MTASRRSRFIAVVIRSGLVTRLMLPPDRTQEEWRIYQGYDYHGCELMRGSSIGMASLTTWLSPRWRWCLCIAPACLLLLFLYLSSQPSTPGTLAVPVSDSPGTHPAANPSQSLLSPVGAGNSTLGVSVLLFAGHIPLIPDCFATVRSHPRPLPLFLLADTRPPGSRQRHRT